MVYKSEILNGIVSIDDNEGKIFFNCEAMNQKQKELFDNYKREIVRESISITSGCIKMDDNLVTALNNSNVQLDLKKLNSKQTFLLDCCIKELERKIDPDVYKEHKQCLKRKRNNECASNFRKKRKNYEKINEIIRAHLNALAKQCKGNLKDEQIEQIRNFLSENKLSITLKYFNSDDNEVMKSDVVVDKKFSSSSSDMSSTNSNSVDSDGNSESNVSMLSGKIEKMILKKNIEEEIKKNMTINLINNNNNIQQAMIQSNFHSVYSVPQYYSNQSGYFSPYILVPNGLVLVNQINNNKNNNNNHRVVS
jgi:hypothetical protein